MNDDARDAWLKLGIAWRPITVEGIKDLVGAKMAEKDDQARLEKLPSVTPASENPKASRWVTAFYHPYVGVVARCESCGHRTKTEDAKRSRFCPGCGAEMTNSRSDVFPGHFQALDDFTRD